MISMPPVFEGKPDLLSLHSWRAEFNESREPIQGYNEVYLNTLSEINPNTDDITLFTDAGDPSLFPNDDAETILKFCRRVRTLESFNRLAHTRLVAVVHDSDLATRRSRRTSYPLKPAGLLKVLSVPIFNPSSRISTPRNHGEPAGPKKTNKKKKRKRTKNGSRLANEELEETSYESQPTDIPEAKRRLVIIVNLDESSLWTVIKTASHKQAAALRSFISDHLALNASLEARITPIIPHTFEMKFNLPFFAVRDLSNGGPYHVLDRLNNMEYIDFLQWQDHHIWAAHAIFDGCHEYEDGGVLDDYEDHKKQHGRECDMVDPITGNKIAWPSITPREFFLGILELRSDQAKREWQGTINRILTRCDIGRKWHDERLGGSLLAPLDHDHEVDDGTEKKAYSDWIHLVIRLLERLRRSLVGCMLVWDAFAEGDIYYFIPSRDDPHMTLTQSIQMAAIKKNFKKMATLLQRLDMISDELKSTMNELGHRLEYENNERARAQITAAMDMKILTWLTFHSLPFTLVAAFMSARPEVLPFPGTVATPLITFFVIEAVIWFTLDRFFKGRYMAKVKNAAVAFYHWARHTMLYKDGVEPDVEAK